MLSHYCPASRLTALGLRLSQLEGKFKFVIRRGIRKLILSALFAIEALRGRIEALVSIKKSVPAPPKTPGQEWSMLCNIGWTEQDVPKLQEALATLKDAQNIAELKKILKRYPKSGKKVVKDYTSNHTIVSQCGLIETVDNMTTVDYKVGRFSYLCDDNTVIITKKSGRGIVNIDSYAYRNDEEALEAGWRMAKKQETVEKEILARL